SALLFLALLYPSALALRQSVVETTPPAPPAYVHPPNWAADSPKIVETGGEKPRAAPISSSQEKETKAASQEAKTSSTVDLLATLGTAATYMVPVNDRDNLKTERLEKWLAAHLVDRNVIVETTVQSVSVREKNRVDSSWPVYVSVAAIDIPGWP